MKGSQKLDIENKKSPTELAAENAGLASSEGVWIERGSQREQRQQSCTCFWARNCHYLWPPCASNISKILLCAHSWKKANVLLSASGSCGSMYGVQRPPILAGIEGATPAVKELGGIDRSGCHEVAVSVLNVVCSVRRAKDVRCRFEVKDSLWRPSHQHRPAINSLQISFSGS